MLNLRTMLSYLFVSQFFFLIPTCHPGSSMMSHPRFQVALWGFFLFCFFWGGIKFRMTSTQTRLLLFFGRFFCPLCSPVRRLSCDSAHWTAQTGICALVPMSPLEMPLCSCWWRQLFAKHLCALSSIYLDPRIWRKRQAAIEKKIKVKKRLEFIQSINPGDTFCLLL